MAFQWPNLYIRSSGTLSNSDHFNHITATMAMAFKMVIFSSKHFFLLIYFFFSPNKVCLFIYFDLVLLCIWQLQATTGMWVTDECKNSFMEMKWKKVHRYIVFKIDEGSRLVTVDKVGGPGEGYDDLTASLPDDDCRYAVFDFDFVTVDNCRKSKIFFIAWSVTLISYILYIML